MAELPSLLHKTVHSLTTLAPTQRAHGIDLSHWQEFFNLPDPQPDPPIDFAIQQVTQGNWVDPLYVELKAAIQAVPIRGAYHYYRSGYSWKEQADLYLSKADGSYHFRVLDEEKKLNTIDAAYIDGVQRWLEYVQDDDPSKKVLGYTSPCFYIDELQNADWMLAWSLWIAQYWLSPSPNKDPGWYCGTRKMNRDENDWTFYQYTADGNNKGAEYGVGSRSIDLNVFKGTVEELRAWLGLEGQEPTGDDLLLALQDLNSAQGLVGTAKARL